MVTREGNEIYFGLCYNLCKFKKENPSIGYGRDECHKSSEHFTGCQEYCTMMTDNNKDWVCECFERKKYIIRLQCPKCGAVQPIHHIDDLPVIISCGNCKKAFGNPFSKLEV